MGFLLPLLGRALLLVDRVLHWLFPVRHHDDSLSVDLDGTGRCLKVAKPLRVLYRDDGVILVKYASFAHSIWRSQELTLFSRTLPKFAAPVADFGCGDGSFSQALFAGAPIEYGIDIDADALKVAAGFGCYMHLVQSTAKSIPLASDSIATCFSNSVLEHSIEVEQTIGEIARVLKAGGVFILTVPVSQFESQLASLFGREESRRINDSMVHRNLWAKEQWERILGRHGLIVVECIAYQPLFVTFLYRLAGMRLLGRTCWEVICSVPFVTSRVMKNLVEHSVDSDSGANVFIVAEKA